jgi:hypothetical protein
VAQLCSADGVTVPIQPAPTSPQLPQPRPHQFRLGLGLGLSFRQTGLAFGYHLRRCLAGEVGVGEAAGQGVEAQQPLIGSNASSSPLAPAEVRRGPLPTVG